MTQQVSLARNGRGGQSPSAVAMAFRAELAALVEKIKAKGGHRIIQSANIIGDHNISTQIAGSGNVVR